MITYIYFDNNTTISFLEDISFVPQLLQQFLDSHKDLNILNGYSYIRGVRYTLDFSEFKNKQRICLINK